MSDYSGQAGWQIHGARHRSMGTGISWVSDGWGLFARRRFTWMLASLAMMVVLALVSLIPLIGSVGQALISPLLYAGLMGMAWHVDVGSDISVRDIFVPFRDSPGRLMALGGVMLVGSIVLLLLLGVFALQLFDVSMADLMSLGEGLEQGQLPAAALDDQQVVLRVLLIVGVYLLLFLPLLAAYWFALPLLFFSDMGIGQALLESLRACLKNIGAMFLQGVLLMAVMIGVMAVFGALVGVLSAVAGEVLGIIVAVLGMFALIGFLVGLMVCSWYASFRDIFLAPEPNTTVL